MSLSRSIVLADDPTTLSRLDEFEALCRRFLRVIDCINDDQTQMVSYSDAHPEGPRFQRRFFADAKHGPRTIDLTIEQGESDSQVDLSLYLSPIPGLPSFRMAEYLFADGSNRPGPDCSADDLKAIFSRYLRLVEERRAGPITSPIRARDLPAHLTTLLRSRLGSADYAALDMLHLSEAQNYGQLEAVHVTNQMKHSPIFSDDFLGFLQSAVPLELQLLRQVQDIVHRHPDIGMNQTVEWSLYVRAYDGWPYVYLDEVGASLNVVEQMKIIRLYPELASDFVRPLATQ